MQAEEPRERAPTERPKPSGWNMRSPANTHDKAGAWREQRAKGAHAEERGPKRSAGASVPHGREKRARSEGPRGADEPAEESEEEQAQQAQQHGERSEPCGCDCKRRDASVQPRGVASASGASMNTEGRDNAGERAQRKSRHWRDPTNRSPKRA